MSFAREIKTIFAIDGEKKYSDAIKEINEKQKVLNAEMKIAGAAFDANGDKQGKLKMQTENLTKQIDLQKQKIVESKAAMEQAKGKFDATGETVQKLSRDYLYAQSSLVGMEEKLVRTTQSLALQESKLKAAGDAAQVAGKKMQGIGEGMNKVGSGMTAGITVPVMAAAAGIAALVMKTTDAADNIATMSDKYGMSTDRIQELTYAGKKLDFEFDAIAGSQSKLIKNMSAAQSGTKAQSDAFKMLKVDVTDSNGHLRDSNVVFGEVIDALGKMTNPTERDAISLKLLGKSALELNPLIKAGSANIAELSAEAHKNGAVMSGENVAAMDKFSDSIAAAQTIIGTTVGEITVELLPTLNKLLPLVEKDIVPAIKDGAKTIGEWAEAFSELDPYAQKTVLTLAGLLVVAGPLLKVAGTATKVTGGLAAGFGKLASAYAEHAAKATGAAVATEGLAAAEGTAASAGVALMAALAPILIVVAAVGATVIALDYMTEASQSSKSASEELAGSCNDTAEAFAKQGNEAEANATIAGNLSEQLYALNDKEKKSNVDKLKMVELVKQLNSVMPELNLSIDEQTGALSKTKKATDDLIASKLKELKAEAGRERLLELYKENITITADLATAQKNWNEASDDWSPLDLRNSIDIMNYKSSVDNLTEAQTNNLESTKELEGTYMTSAEVISDANGAIVDSGQETVQLTQEQLDAQQSAREEWAAAIEQATKDHYAAMGTIDDEGIKQSETTAAQAKANLEKQALDFQNYNANLEALSARVTPTVLAQLEELGPQYSSMLGELNGYTDAELQAWVNTWTNKGSLARAAADATFAAIYAAYGDPYTTFYGLGQATIDGLIAGMQANVGGAYTAAEEAAKGIAAAARRNPTTKKTIPKYASGIKYVPEDQIALIHKGEAVITAAENPYANLAKSGNETFDGSQYNMSGLENSIMSANAITAKAQAAGGYAKGESSQASGGHATGESSQAAGGGQLVHSGKITVEGVNNKGDLIGVTQIIMDQLRFENMMSGRG